MLEVESSKKIDRLLLSKLFVVVSCMLLGSLMELEWTVHNALCGCTSLKIVSAVYNGSVGLAYFGLRIWILQFSKERVFCLCIVGV